MAAYFGLHVGATSISVAVVKDKKVEVLANHVGDRVIPALVTYNDGEMAVGVYSSRNAANVISNCRRLLDCDSVDAEEVESVQKRCFCKIKKMSKLNEFGYELKSGNGNVAEVIGVYKILQLLFKHLMDTAAHHIGSQSESYAVLAVPMNFTPKQVQLFRDAATSNGFQILQVINEPSAAILGSQILENNKEMTNERQIALVFRVGGTSVTVTIFSVFNGYYQVLASCDRKDLGGENLTDLIVEHLCEEFQRLYKVDIRTNTRSKYKLRFAAEDCKKILSTMSTTQCSIESLHDGIDFQCNVSRARLESLISSFSSQFLDPVEEALKLCQINADEITNLIFCGGTCKIPGLQKVIRNHFSKTETVYCNWPDELLASGAALQAENFKGFEDSNLNEELYVPTLTNSLYYKVNENGENKLIFEKGSFVPVEKSEVIKPIGESFDIYILELDNNTQKEENLLAKVTVDCLEEESISVTFYANKNNSIDVTITGKETNKCFNIA